MTPQITGVFYFGIELRTITLMASGAAIGGSKWQTKIGCQHNNVLALSTDKQNVTITYSLDWIMEY